MRKNIFYGEIILISTFSITTTKRLQLLRLFLIHFFFFPPSHFWISLDSPSPHHQALLYLVLLLHMFIARSIYKPLLSTAYRYFYSLIILDALIASLPKAWWNCLFSGLLIFLVDLLSFFTNIATFLPCPVPVRKWVQNLYCSHITFKYRNRITFIAISLFLQNSPKNNFKILRDLCMENTIEIVSEKKKIYLKSITSENGIDFSLK